MGVLVKAGGGGYVKFYRNGVAFGSGYNATEIVCDESTGKILCGRIKSPLVIAAQFYDKGVSLKLLPNAVGPVPDAARGSA